MTTEQDSQQILKLYKVTGLPIPRVTELFPLEELLALRDKGIVQFDLCYDGITRVYLGPKCPKELKPMEEKAPKVEFKPVSRIPDDLDWERLERFRQFNGATAHMMAVCTGIPKKVLRYFADNGWVGVETSKNGRVTYHVKENLAYFIKLNSWKRQLDTLPHSP